MAPVIDVVKYTHRSLGLCIAYLIGALFIVSHFTSGPATVNTLPTGIESGTQQLDKRVSKLQEIWNGVAMKRRVTIGTATGWPQYPRKGREAAVYAPTVFYGCTMVVIVSGRGIVIGHFAQGSQGSYADPACHLDTKAAVKKYTDQLDDAEADADIEDATKTARVWIVHSNTIQKSSDGYKAFRENFEALGIPDAHIEEIGYYASSGTGEPRPDNLDKLAVQWEPKADGSGATATVYIQSDTPKFVGHYDCNGDPVSNSKMKRNAPACLPKNRLPGPFASGIFPTSWNHTTPASTGPTGGTTGALGTPITNTGPLST